MTKLRIEDIPDELSEEQLQLLFKTVDLKELAEMAVAAKAISQRLVEDGPKDDDELWTWVKLNLGIEIPRVAVCEGHEPPFKFLADAYFSRFPAILAMGNRGGGKTFLVALLHWLNSQFKPAIESCTFGATEAQSLRCYAHLKSWIYDENGDKKPEIASSIMRETNWKKVKPPMGSKVEVLAGTPEAVNGPHPQVAHADEVELMREDTWTESRNMAVSKTLPDGTNYPSQEILTSTRKSLHGRMQTLIDGIQEAAKLGMTPDYTLIVWCIFEIAKEVPSCQAVSEKDRKARLKELGKDPCSLCDCHLHMKGRWPDTGKPRLLKDVCRGRLFRSRGYLPYDDVVQKFKQNTSFTWEAQQECSKPETENNYLKGFSDERHGIRGFDADPANGKIFEAIDWGGTNPHAINFYQQLDFDLEVLDFYEKPLTLREGTLVVFDEIYIAEIGVDKLAKLLIAKENEYRRKWGDSWEPYARFADPQGKSQRLDFKDQGLVCTWKTTRDFDTQVEWLQREWWEEDLLRVVIDKCPMFSAEAQSWQKDPDTGKQVDEFNHCMSNLRYCTANIRTINRRARRGRSTPKARGRHRSATVVTDTRRAISGPLAMRERGDMEDWRKRLGGPAGGAGF